MLEEACFKFEDAGAQSSAAGEHSSAVRSISLNRS